MPYQSPPFFNNILAYDSAGDHTGFQAAKVIADNGGQVEIMTRDRLFALAVMAMNLVLYMRSLQKKNTKFTYTYTLDSVEKDGNELTAIIGSNYCGIRRKQRNDQIIITLPDLFRNKGESYEIVSCY